MYKYALPLPEDYSQVSCASRYTTTFLETVCGIAVLVFAEHKVLIDVFAVLANEEACGFEWC